MRQSTEAGLPMRRNRASDWRGGRRSCAVLVSCLAAVFSVPTSAQPAGNPGYDRPGLGFAPAVLRRADVTIEQGLPDWSRADGVSLYDADSLFRAGIGHSLELQLGTGWNRLDGPGEPVDGRADTSLGVKFAPPATGNLSWGVLGSVELADGARPFRAERSQYLLATSINWQRSMTHALGLYLETLHGDTDSQLVAVNAGWTLTDVLGVYVELGLQHLDGCGHGSMGGGGLTWQATPRVQFDLSARHRLGGNADTWQAGVGIAVYLGR